MPDSAADRLVAAARPFWEAEAEIARRFFAGPPSREAWIRYLRSAVYKELNPTIGYGPTDGYANALHMAFAEIVEGFRGLDAGGDRRRMLGALKDDDRGVRALRGPRRGPGVRARPPADRRRRRPAPRGPEAQRHAAVPRRVGRSLSGRGDGADRRRRGRRLPRGGADLRRRAGGPAGRGDAESSTTTRRPITKTRRPRRPNASAPPTTWRA